VIFSPIAESLHRLGGSEPQRPSSIEPQQIVSRPPRPGWEHSSHCWVVVCKNRTKALAKTTRCSSDFSPSVVSKLFQNHHRRGFPLPLPCTFFGQLMSDERTRSIVQACGIQRLTERGAGLGDFTDAGVAGDHEAAEGEGRFFEGVVGIR
jgi:hypothetical protein